MSKIDLVMVPAAADPAALAALKEEKKAGRVRYIGVQTIVGEVQAAQLEAIMRNEPIDFIGVDYDVSNRFVEDKILPLAQERKIGVMAFFPFSNTYGSELHRRHATSSRASATGPFRSGPPSSTPRRGRSSSSSTSSATRPSPWPARGRPSRRTCSTTSAAASAACRTRRRGSAWRSSSMHSPRLRRRLPAPPRSCHRGLRCRRPSSTATSVSTRRRPDSPRPSAATGTTLFVKPGTNPEVPLLARSETRFQDPRGPFFEFQLDAPGKGDRCRSGAAGSAGHADASRWSGSKRATRAATRERAERPVTGRREVGPRATEERENRMINRREFLGITAGAGATLALTPELLRALRAVGRKAHSAGHSVFR